MKKKIIISLALLSSITLVAATTSTIAWFKYGTDIPLADAHDNPLTAGAEAFPYGGGDGSYETPFEISNRNHLYNLAWLQYLGTYNESSIQQLYFEVTAPIDMTGITLPPIGTDTYPFLGHFDGNGNVISNLTVSNNFSDYGAAHPVTVDSDHYDAPQIVGFFGVVGDLPDGNITYDSSIVSMSNFTLNNLKVTSKSAQTLIGLAAGYVDGDMSGVKLDGKLTLDVDGQTSTAITSITDNLSDYGLVGYTTKTGSGGSYSQKLSSYFNNEESTGPGDDDDWGGSVRFDEVSSRLHEIIMNQGGKVPRVGTGSMHEFSEVKSNSYNGVVKEESNTIFSIVDSAAGKDPVQDMITFTYLGANSGTNYYYNNPLILSLFTDPSMGGYLRMVLGNNNPNTAVYRIKNWEENTQTSYSFDSSIGYKAFKLNFDSDAPFVYNSTNYTVLYFNPVASSTTGGRIQSSPTATGYTNAFPSESSTSMMFRSESISPVYQLRSGSYFPLKYSSDSISGDPYYSVSPNNTGYIAGLSSGNNGSPRFASYDAKDNLKKSFNNAALYDDRNCEILTYAKTKNNNDEYEWGWHTIRDSHNGDSRNTQFNGSNYTDVTPQSAGFRKYEAYAGTDDIPAVIEKTNSPLARNSLHSILGNSKRVNGLHFDGNPIGTGSLSTIPYARISTSPTAIDNGAYKIPSGSIDFNLKERGIINFFAGTYSTTNCNFNFFSIYDIKRDSNYAITSFKEIYQIYENSFEGRTPADPSYIYKYSDGTYSIKTGTTAATSADCTADKLLFDVNAALRLNATGTTSTAANFAPHKNTLYYFEVPVNAGEYAMGKVSAGSTNTNTIQGAYMLYLDIGVNAELVDTDKVTAYSILTTRSGAPFPAGVDFLVTGVGNNGGESIGVVIASSSKGTIVFDITRGASSDTIAISPVSGTTQVGAFSYKSGRVGTNITVTGLSGDPPSQSPGGERILSIHLIKLDTSVYDIRVTDQLDSEGVITSSIYEVDSGSGFVTSTYDAVVALSEEINITLPSDATNYPNSLRNLEIAAILTRSEGTGEFATTYDTESCSCKDKIVDVDIEKNGATIAITVTEGYAFLIGGVRKVTGNTY